MSVDPWHEPLLVPDSDGWRAWLDDNEHDSDGIWLLLAKKGTVEPTTLTYAQALEEALCSGWIDGQKRRYDDAMSVQRFTPRRKRSTWSKRNVGIVGDLIEQGRMRPRGQSEIDLAIADGRWERAYPGAAEAEVPEDLRSALGLSPRAEAHFDGLPRSESYPLLLRVLTADPARREAVIRRLVEKLEGMAGGGTGPSNE